MGIHQRINPTSQILCAVDKEKPPTVLHPMGQLLHAGEKLIKKDHIGFDGKRYWCGRWLKIPPTAIPVGFREADCCDLCILGHETRLVPRPEPCLVGELQEQTRQGRANCIVAAYLIDASYSDSNSF